MPERIQLRRTKGWRMPANTVKVDRSTKWGNPFRGDSGEDAVQLFEQWLTWPGPGRVLACEAREQLTGKNLACWCAHDRKCHADVLLRVANEGE